MSIEISDVLSEALSELAKANSLKALEAVRISFLGKQGRLTTLLKTVGQLPIEQRAKFGQQVNLAKEKLQAALQEKRQQLEEKQLKQDLKGNIQFDLSMPGRGLGIGTLHPITQTIQFIQDYFFQLGFDFAEGPEIEDDFHNFEALNIPKHHPARGMHDTFYFPGEKRPDQSEHLLRTHTSTVQIRYLETLKRKLPDSIPCRVISAGRVYRHDYDITHTPMFHQIEGVVIDKLKQKGGIHMGHLKGILSDFLSAFFERDLNTRFRSSYFPFTEPSAEVDVQCVKCDGKGCRICKQTGWLEVLGCGMMHPHVLEQVGLDSEQYQGFAFGMGVERLTMLRHNIPDLRLFFENDQPFLRQFL